MSEYIYDDLSKYKTLIKKTKEYLGTHFYGKLTNNIEISESAITVYYLM